VDELIKNREDSFFKDAYKSRELSKQHPLLHLITTYKKLSDANNIELSPEEMVSPKLMIHSLGYM
jgi:hypothetical protein